MSYESRIINLDFVEENTQFSSGSYLCPDNENKLDNFKLYNRIGSESINGEVFLTCLCKNIYDCSCDDTNMYATKKIILKDEDLPFLENHFHKDALTRESWAEICSLELCKFMLGNKITPNVPLYYKYFICNSCKFSNPQLLKRYNSTLDDVPCVHLISEFAENGDVKSWCLEKVRNKDEWNSMFFQVFNALYAFQKYFDLVHNDLHWGNVLVKKVPENSVIHYTINGNKFIIPTYGNLFLLWDFGLANIKRKMEISNFQEHFAKIYSRIPRNIYDYSRIIQTIPVCSDIFATNNKFYRNHPEYIPKFIPNDVMNMYSTLLGYFHMKMDLDKIIYYYFSIYKFDYPVNPISLGNYSSDLAIENFVISDKIKWLLNDDRLNNSVPYFFDNNQLPYENSEMYTDFLKTLTESRYSENSKDTYMSEDTLYNLTQPVNKNEVSQTDFESFINSYMILD